MLEAMPPAKGTRPEGAISEADASRQVREMFTRIAPSYDLLNHVLSLQLDRVWRNRVTRQVSDILRRKEALVLDLCCGTGDLTLSLAAEGTARVIGADFAHPMLIRAREKSGAKELRANPAEFFFEADALRLPFASAAFDLVTTAFGFRNLANYEDGLREIERTMKPGGTFAVLEFTEPPETYLGSVYRWYFREVLPRIGGLVSGDRQAYSYLPKSVSRFLRPAELAALMERVGFTDVQYKVWNFGTVALHTGNKAR